MKYCFILVFLAGSLMAKAQNGNDGQKMEVMMKMLGLKNALLLKDSVTLSKLLSDDLTYGHSNGLVQTKAELIHTVMDGEQDYKSIEATDMMVRIYDNTGIVTTKLRTSLIYEGKPTELYMNVLLTWIKKNGDWQLIARQSVKLTSN